LALASLDGFAAGLFSSDASQPLRADAAALAALAKDHLGNAFQVDENNHLEGLDGRLALMKGLGVTLQQRAEYFPGDQARVGNLFDHIVARYGDHIAATDLLRIALHAFGGIWPGRLQLGGVNLGDTWRCDLVRTGDATSGLIPFHKLSQWLTYSLIEPLQDAGVSVGDIDGLTGLAEYRNGGLFVDTGVLELSDASMVDQPHKPADRIIVEWRALTVALLDRVAEIIRRKLGRTPDTLPLASVLEGGTWAAGRRIAAQKRPDAGPPIRIVSDGSVF